MDIAQAVELLTTIADQIPMKGHEEDQVYGSLQVLMAPSGDKEAASQQILHLLMNVPLVRPVRQQAKEAVSCLQNQKQSKRNAKQ